MSEIESVKYSSYTPAQKKASQLYRQNNKEKINEQRKKYYQAKKLNDPKFLEYKRIKAKEYYEKKKLAKVVKPDVEKFCNFVDIIPNPKEIKTDNITEMEKLIIPESTEKHEEKTSPEIVKEIENISSPVDEPVKKKKKSKSKK